MSFQQLIAQKNLDISIVELKSLGIGQRLESDYYTQISFGSKNWYSGGDIIDVVQYGTSDALNEENKGFPVLRLNEFDGLFIGTPSKYCDLIDEKQYANLKLKKNDILICRTNGNKDLVGRSAIVMEDQEVAFASYLFRVKPNDKISPSTLLIYLNSKQGKAEIRKHKMVSNQANFSPAKFRQILIPNFGNKIQKEIEKIVESSYKGSKQSKSLYYQAEQLLLKELGLENYQPTENNISIKDSGEVEIFSRMDAEFFQPKYDEIMKKIENKNIFGLADICKIQRGSLISPDFYNENEGIPYIRGADFSSGILGDEKFVYIDSSFKKTREQIVNEGDILFASIGSVGTSALVTRENKGSYISNNIGKLVIKDKKMLNSVYLQAILQSVVGQLQLKRFSTQTAQPKISNEQLAEIQIPVIDIEVQQKIADLITQSYQARNESKKLLEVAKRAVEVFVEEDEEKAIEFISKNV